MNIFLDIKFCEFFLGHPKIGLVLGVISIICNLGSFLKVNIQNRDILWGYKNFKYFFEVLDIPDFFWGTCKQ